MKFKNLYKRKENSTSDLKEQKIFSCSNCENELFLSMKFCEKCGGEIEWPEEYRRIVEHKPKNSKEIQSIPISKNNDQ